MKNIFLSIILSLITFAGYSTSRGIEIVNQSQCDVYLQVRGSQTCPSCDVDYFSNLIIVPSGGMVGFPITPILGGTFPGAPAFVHSAILYSGPRHCQRLNTWLIGDSVCGFPPYVEFYALAQDCRVLCDRLTARWIPAPCTGLARLIIT